MSHISYVLKYGGHDKNEDVFPKPRIYRQTFHPAGENNMHPQNVCNYRQTYEYGLSYL
jgi:hypothetical protein